MDDWTLSLYVREVVRQRDIARFAARRLHTQRGAVAVHADVQAVLTAAASMSKLFWAPTSEAWSSERVAFAVDRAARLREIANPKLVLQRRAVRNAIEHFDHRLDDLVFEGRGSSIIDDYVGPREAMLLPENTAWLRHYDPQTTEASVLTASAVLGELMLAMERAAEAAEEWIETHRF